jgi:hypothetical protein
MKKLIWKLVLPLTVLSFMFVTKSWYAFVVDGPNLYMKGFPLICESPGFHTSLSVQLFVAEFLFNLLIYFLFWYVIVFLFNRFVLKIMIPKIVYRLLIFLSILTIALYASILTISDLELILVRDFDVEVRSTSITVFGL